MAGRLYGIGVGPGDPELMTLKAARLIRESDVIAVPGRQPKESVAYRIAAGAVPEIDTKELIAVDMPMIKDEAMLRKSHQDGAKQVMEYLEAGKQVAFLTLGDVSIYSTYMYIHHLVEEAGYEASLVSGIPSFCAAAARLGISLAEKAQMLHIVPASYPIEEALALPGTKVFMKSGKQIGRVKQMLMEHGCKALMVENCGMPNEKTYRNVSEFNEEAGYYSLIICYS